MVRENGIQVERLWRIELTKATFGIVTVDGMVTKAPPMGRWMLGKHINEVRRWVIRHGRIQEVKTDE